MTYFFTQLGFTLVLGGRQRVDRIETVVLVDH